MRLRSWVRFFQPLVTKICESLRSRAFQEHLNFKLYSSVFYLTPPCVKLTIALPYSLLIAGVSAKGLKFAGERFSSISYSTLSDERCRLPGIQQLKNYTERARVVDHKGRLVGHLVQVLPGGSSHT